MKSGKTKGAKTPIETHSKKIVKLHLKTSKLSKRDQQLL
jgi:hypothetical protein